MSDAPLALTHLNLGNAQVALRLDVERLGELVLTNFGNKFLGAGKDYIMYDQAHHVRQP